MIILSNFSLPSETMAKPAVPNLRLAHRVDNILPDSKRRKLNSLDLNESTNARAKGDPEFELSQILGKIFSRFIENPAYSAFVLPISHLQFPDYESKIPNPLCLKQIHEVSLCFIVNNTIQLFSFRESEDTGIDPSKGFWKILT